MKVTILGGGGFIGTRLTELLERDETHEITAISRSLLNKGNKGSRVKRTKINIEELSSIRKHIEESDAIIDLSAPASSSRHPRDKSGVAEQLQYPNHLRSKFDLYTLAHQANSRVISILTGGAYYGRPRNNLASEAEPSNPENSYAFNSCITAELIKLLRNQHKLNATGLLVSNPYGPWQYGTNGQGVIGSWIQQRLQGEKPRIIGDISRIGKDFIYIDDVCRLISSILSNKSFTEYSIYNVGSGEITSLVEVYNKIRASYSHPIAEEWPELTITDTNKGSNYALDSTRAQTEFNWKPRIKMDDGINRTLRWFSAHGIKTATRTHDANP